MERDFGIKLAEFWQQKKAMGRVKLRKIQYQIAEKGGPGAAAMAIWLDKKIFPDENPDKRFGAPPNLDPNAPPHGKKSFEQFCVDAGYPRPFPKQDEMRRFIFESKTKDARLLLGSRGYGKTDYTTIMGAAYDVYLNGSESRVLIVTKTAARNAAILEEIANALEANGITLEKRNSKYIKLAGNIGKDYSVEAITLRTSFRGRHPKIIVMDDPVTEEDVSKAMRKLVKRKYDEGYKLCKNMVIIGQPAHADDLYAELRPRLEKMEVPHGSIPELDADLEAMLKAGVSPVSIEMSYHLRVPVSGTMPFSSIKYIDALPNGPTVAFMDPSDGGDYTAMSIFRGIGDGWAIKGHCWQKAWYHCVDEFVPLLVKHNVIQLVFETNSTGKQPIEQLTALLAQYGITVVAKHSDTNKHAVIMAAGQYAHMIHLSKDSDPVYTDLVVKYEKGADYDDPPDSLARGLEHLGFIKGKK